MKKYFKKISAVLLAALMVLAMAVPAFAADVDLKITGLEAGDKVDLYQIGTAGDDGVISFITGVSFADETKPTSQEITDIAVGLQNGDITATKVVNAQAVTGTEFTYNTSAAGAFIAIVKSQGDRVYNPILLAANLTADGLTGGTVGAGSTYAFGETAVAKSSEPTVTKVESTGKEDTKDGETIQTGSVGDRVTYTVTPTLPSYPANATNKTMYLADTMTDGLTFEFDTLTINWNDKELTADADGNFKDGDTVIATAKEVGNGFNMSFVYDNLDGKAPTVTYSAIVNDNAVIGGDGNENHVEYFYAGNPTQGDTYDDVDEKPNPQEDENIKYKDDKKVVYTYEIKFRKVENPQAEDIKALAGAVFGLYEDQECTKLIDTIVTNENGIGASAKVGAGTYYLKELVAPQGYALSDTVTPVTSSWTSATTTTTSSTVRTAYTSTKPEAPNDQQVGWLKDNNFYAMDEFTQEEADASGGTILPAYLSAHTETATSVTFTDNQGAGSGVVPVADIPNTKLGELPSTGSIGTYIFTIVGVAVLAAAAYMVINGKKAKK